MERPETRAVVLPRLARLLKHGNPVKVEIREALDKRALEDSFDFVEWAILRGKKYTANDTRGVLDRLGIPLITEADKKPPKKGPLQVGEQVYPDRNKNTNEANTDACRKYHLSIGQVEKVEKDAVVVRFEDNRLTRFEGGNVAGKAIGLYRGTPATAAPTGKTEIEVVYIKDKEAKPPTLTQKEQVQDYLERGRQQSQDRHMNYYSGLALKQSEGKNGYYFTIFSRQRDRFPRAMNPQKGTLLYVGRQGGRPGGWQQELAEFRAALLGETVVTGE